MSNALFNAGLWSLYEDFSCWQDSSSPGKSYWEPQINHVKSWCSLAMFALWCSALGTGVTSWQKWYGHVMMEEDDPTALWLPPFSGCNEEIMEGWMGSFFFFSFPFSLCSFPFSFPFSLSLADQFSSVLHFRISDQWKLYFLFFFVLVWFCCAFPYTILVR